MPLFPVLDFENLVQENDKTRIDVAKSYASGVDAITVLEVRPSKLTAAPIDVTDAGYLDWQYPFEFEIDDDNNKIDFDEGGGELTAVIGQESYTPAELAAEIQAQMRSAGSLTYLVTVDADNVFTIAAEAEFSLLTLTGTNAADNALNLLLGFAADSAGAITYDGAAVERIEKIITLSVGNGDVGQTAQIDRSIYVISEVADRLFSTDDKLRKHEADIMKYVPDGRATFKDVHRRAQALILAWLDTQGYTDDFADRLTVARISNVEEVSEWATMMTLRLIFESVRNAKDDIFDAKATKYAALEMFYRNRANLVLDLNRDGVGDSIVERTDIRSCRVVRR